MGTIYIILCYLIKIQFIFSRGKGARCFYKVCEHTPYNVQQKISQQLFRRVCVSDILQERAKIIWQPIISNVQYLGKHPVRQLSSA
jgi:hypothetical protein